MFIIVDFPEPEAPITATNSPLRIVTLMPRRAATSISPILYVLCRSRIRITSASPSKWTSRDGGDGLLCSNISEAKESPRRRGSLAPHRQYDLVACLEVPRDNFAVRTVADAETHPDGYGVLIAKYINGPLPVAPSLPGPRSLTRVGAPAAAHGAAASRPA